MKRILCGALVCLACMNAGAASLGIWGDTWDVREQNLISVLKNNLQEHFGAETQEQVAEEMRQRVEESAMRPPPVEGLVTSRETHTRLFDPAFIVNRDIADQNGVVFARKGQRVSPFDVIPVFDETLYFIDADDKRQIAWMQQQRPATTSSRIILVSGNIRDSALSLGSRIYFDQNGTLTARFGIRQIPAEVKQAPGKSLLVITEYGLPDR